MDEQGNIRPLTEQERAELQRKYIEIERHSTRTGRRLAAKLVPIPDDELEAVRGLNKKDRIAWRRAKQRKLEAQAKKRRKQQRKARRAGR